MKTRAPRWWTLLALCAFLLHLAGAAHYGFFRDELYFIACAQHLAWGYVDQPPLVAIAAWLAAPFGYPLLAVRLLPCISAALAVYVACALTRELGAGRYGQLLAGVAVLLMPATLLLGSVLSTTSFEPLTWTLLILLAMRIAHGAGARTWVLAGLVAAFGLYAKYSIAMLAAGLLAGMLLTRERRALLTPWLPAAAALAGVAIAPNVWWQVAHHWPMLAVLHGDAVKRHALQSGLQMEFTNTWRNAIAFIAEQALYTGPLTTPLWLLGLYFFSRRSSPLQALPVAYALLVVLCIALQAKGYYIIGIYPALVCGGAVLVERAAFLRRGARAALLCAIVVSGVLLMPLSLAILPVRTFISYSHVLRLTGSGANAHLVQPLYADEFGWRGVTARVARVYDALPAQLRARTAIYADTYAYAGALNLYGPRYGLPTPLSGQNTFWVWGTHGYDGSSVIAVGATQYHLFIALFRSVRQVAVYSNPYRWALEGPLPIYLCTKPIAPLPQMWRRLRYYGP